jgi:ribosome-associated toxin RatA of RatAB toxin-antitoxin module
MTYSTTASAVFPYPEGRIFDTLIDYDAWSEWLPSVSSSRLLTKEGNLALAELGWAARGEETVIVECIQTPNQSLLARVIQGRVPVREIEWTIAPGAAGSSRVTMKVKRSSLRRAMNSAACLAALKAAVEAASPGPEQIPGAENLFELWETDKGLVCWVRGRKYTLTSFEGESCEGES